MTPFDGKNIHIIGKNICEKDVVFKPKYWDSVSDEAKDFI